MLRPKKKLAIFISVVVFTTFFALSYFRSDIGKEGEKVKVHLEAKNVLELEEFPERKSLDTSKLALLTEEGKDEEVDFDAVLLDLKREREKWNGNKEDEVEEDPKYILYWNEAYGSRDYGFCCGRDPYEKYNCPVKNCYATNNR